MATKETVTFIDDLDGITEEDVQTVEFGLDGVTFEIDLSQENRDRLRASVEEFVDAARRTGGRIKRGTVSGTGPAKTDPEQNAAMRDWARKNGFTISDRGRISGEIQDAYQADLDAKQRAASEAKPKRATRSRKRPVTV